MKINNKNKNSTIKKFRYKYTELGHSSFVDGIIAVDDEDNIVAVLTDDMLAHEGLSTDDFVEFLTDAGYEIDAKPMNVSEEYFSKIVDFKMNS